MRSLPNIYYKTEEIIVNDLFCLFVDSEPLNYDDAVKDEKWRQAMEEEINAIEKNNTWELSTLPKDHEAISVKWVYKEKKNANGDVVSVTTRTQGHVTGTKEMERHKVTDSQSKP